MPKSTWRWMKRRAAIVSTIGQLKAHKRQDKSHLKGELGDRINVIFAAAAAAAMNQHKIMKVLAQTPALLAGFLACLLKPSRNRTAALTLNGGC